MNTEYNYRNNISSVRVFSPPIIYISLTNIFIAVAIKNTIINLYARPPNYFFYFTQDS